MALFGSSGEGFMRKRWFMLALFAVGVLGLALSGRQDWPAGIALFSLVVAIALMAGLMRGEYVPTVYQERPAVPQDGLSARAVIDAVPDPALLINDRGAVIAANRSARTLFPTLREGMAMTSVLRAPDILEAVRLAATGAARQSAEHHERGTVERWFAVTATGIGEAQANRSRSVLLVLRDLTEIRRIEKMRVDFVASASHELRTPLASLLGFIETLKGPARDDPAARDRFLGIMLAQARRMSRLIDDLLSLSRIEANAHISPATILDLGPLLGHVADTLRPLAADSGVELLLDGHTQSLPIYGDRDELLRLFENLVQNAIKYGASGERVAITLRRKDHESGRSEAEISVRDFGPGIAAEHIPRLTERFYRVDVASSRDKGGTGLGLAIVKHALAHHRARLAITSQEGEGACFTTTFELAKPALPAAQPAA